MSSNVGCDFVCVCIYIYIYIYIIRHHYTTIVSRGWPSLRYPLPNDALPFPFVGFPGGDTQCPSVISYPAGVPCPGPLPSSDLFNHVCDLCLFSDPARCLFFCPGM